MTCGRYGSMTTLSVVNPSGTPVDFVHVVPSLQLAYTPRPLGVKMPPTALSPVPTISVPPFAAEKATPPIACDGILSPIERQLPPPVVDSQIPPVAGAAKTRFAFPVS